MVVSLIVLVSVVPSQAQLGLWRLISPTEYTAFPASNIHGIYMLSGGTSGKGSGRGWMSGDNGLVFTWDGFSWNQEAVPVTTCQLNSVNFGGPLNPLTSITSSSGWIVGGHNPVGGACGAPESMFFNGVNWVAYAVPSAALATTELRGVYLVQSGSPGNFIQAYAVGTESGADGAFWVWNGVPGSGGAWTRCSVAGCGPIVPAPVNSLYMTQCTGSPCAATDGIAVADAGGPTNIYRFVGGAWNPLATPVPAVDLNGVAMSSRTNGWAVGDSCTIVRTTDGNTWSGAVSPGTCTADLRSIVMLSSSEAYAVGDADATGVTIVHGTSLDSSPAWTRIPGNQIALTVPAGPGLNSVTFAPSGGNLWAAGASGAAAFCLNNCGSVSGAIWSTTTSPQQTDLRAVYMVSDSDGFAVGAADSAGNPTIIRWNGGTFSWTRAPFVAPVVSPTTLLDVHMTSSSSAWAVGGTGAVASSLYFDGNTWTGRPVPACGAGCFLIGVHMVSDSNSWAVGTGGVIMHSTSTGGAFTISPSAVALPGGQLNSVFFDPTSGGQSGWAVGGGGANPPTIVHTTNGGADAWPLIANPAAPGVELTSVYFQDSTHGWATGVGGPTTTILFWNGFSWTLVPVTVSPPFTAPLDLWDIQVLGFGTGADGWAVGRDAVGLPVTVHYDGLSWSTLLTPSIPTPGFLLSLSIRSATNGLAVGPAIGAGTLALVLHLDPPGGVGYTGTTTAITSLTFATTTPVITTSSATTTQAGTSSVVTSSTSSTSSQITTSTSTSETSTTSSTSSQAASTVTVTPATTSSTTTPLVMPAIPGFPVESILAGIVLGLTTLVIVRRRKR